MEPIWSTRWAVPTQSISRVDVSRGSIACLANPIVLILGGMGPVLRPHDALEPVILRPISDHERTRIPCRVVVSSRAIEPVSAFFVAKALQFWGGSSRLVLSH